MAAIFKCIFLNENVQVSVKISLKFVPIWQYPSFGSDDGLALARRQAIIWTNDGLVCWRICASLGLNELTKVNIPNTFAKITQLILCCSWCQVFIVNKAILKLSKSDMDK